MSNGAIYEECCNEVNLEELTSAEKVRVTRTINSYESLITRHKKAGRPALPKSISEVQLTEEYLKYEHFNGYTNEFLLIDNGIGANRIIIFGTLEFLQYMSKCDKLWGDGTFKQSPKHFYQLYTIHGYVRGQMFPFIFAILPNKYETTYIRMLNLLQDKLKSMNLRFQVKQFQVDFEMAMINAITKVLKCEVKGSAFHYCQSLIKKMASLGLTKQYKNKN